MKTVCTLLLIVLLSQSNAFAQRQRGMDSVDVTIRLKKYLSKNAAPLDSVLVFFDRYDHSGAGVIKQVYYPVNNQIIIPQVPEGRYFIGIYCLGAHMQFLSDITFVNKRRSNKLRFNLNRSEEYKPGTYLPDFVVDLRKLSITNIKSFK